MKPEVLLLDEPCSALDPIATARIEELIDELKKDYTVVIVSHSMQQAARISEYTAFMYLGELIEFGDTKTIFTHPQRKRRKTSSPAVSADRYGSLTKNSTNWEDNQMETKAHTVKRFDAELEELNNNVVKMASAVEEQLGRLGDALVNLNADEAAKVMAEDHVINSWEAELDDYLETIISRRQPQAVDLRLLLGYYRMTTDFERMGDEIRNAAKGVRKLSELVKPLSEPALANVSTLFSLHALLRVMGDDMIACVRLLDPGVHERWSLGARLCPQKSMKRSATQWSA